MLLVRKYWVNTLQNGSIIGFNVWKNIRHQVPGNSFYYAKCKKSNYLISLFLNKQQIQKQYMITKPPEHLTLLKTLDLQKMETNQSPDTLFRYLCQLVKNNSFVNIIPKHKSFQSLLLANQKAIKPKMFIKVACWMEKMCIQTLNFSYETLQYSLKILKRYLQLSEESPKFLQMLGCISLHIASKINEKSIISIDSYVECCLNIFNRNQFQEMEAQVYQKVAWSIPPITLYDISDFIQYEVLNFMAISQNQQSSLKKAFSILLKDLQFLDTQPFTLLINLWVQILHNPQFEFQKQQFLHLLQDRKFQF